MEWYFQVHLFLCCQTPLISRHQLWISVCVCVCVCVSVCLCVCDSDIPIACYCYLEVMIVYDSKCVCVCVCVCVCDTRPGLSVWLAVVKLACVGVVPASLLVCHNALWLDAWMYAMTAPFLHAGCCSFAGTWSFLSTFRLHRNKNLCFCALCCFILLKLADHVFILQCWCSSKLYWVWYVVPWLQF